MTIAQIAKINEIAKITNNCQNHQIDNTDRNDGEIQKMHRHADILWPTIRNNFQPHFHREYRQARIIDPILDQPNIFRLAFIPTGSW